MSRTSEPGYPRRFPVQTQLLSRNPKLRGPKRSFRRRLKYFYWRLVRLQGSPDAIARGLACGVFAGLFPLFGLQIIIGILLAIALRGNKIVAAAGTWISNPLTYVPIYAFNFHVGQWLLNDENQIDISLSSWPEVEELGLTIISTLLVGCLAVGLVGAACGYFLGFWLVRRVRDSHRSTRRHKG